MITRCILSVSVLLMLALPLSLVLYFNLPTNMLAQAGRPHAQGSADSGVASGGSERRRQTAETDRRAVRQLQVKALQEQLAGLKKLRPGEDASLAEVQRWQEMRQLLKRQVQLVIEDVTLEDGSATALDTSSRGKPINDGTQAPPPSATPAVGKDVAIQADSQSAQPIVSPLVTAEAERASEVVQRGTSVAAEPSPSANVTEGKARGKGVTLGAPGRAVGRDVVRKQLVKRKRRRERGSHSSSSGAKEAQKEENNGGEGERKGAIIDTEASIVTTPSGPNGASPAKTTAPAAVKSTATESFSLRKKDPRYIVPPKAMRFEMLPDQEGSWKYCYLQNQLCKQCTLKSTAPGPTCDTCHSCPMTLAWPDKHPRANPTMAAQIQVDATGTLADVFVKFPCIPTDRRLPEAGRVDPHHRCNRGVIPEDVEGPNRHVMSIQRITDDCGLDGIAARYWIDHAMSVVEGGPFVRQEGIFAQTAPGQPLEKIGGERRKRVRAIPRDQILEAALHDFILCEGDRHMGNIYLDDENNIMLIDNDRALGNKASMTREIMKQQNIRCQPSSLFLPMTMESNRLNHGDLGYLDYRCHVRDDKNLWLPPKTRQCLQMFSGMTAEQIQKKYDILFIQWAEDLRSRSRDLLEHGFWQALLNSLEHSKSEFHRLAGSRPPESDDRFRHWRGAFWRPLLPTNCDP